MKQKIIIRKKQINIQKIFNELLGFINDIAPDFKKGKLTKIQKEADLLIKKGTILDEDEIRIILLEKFFDYLKESI